MSSSRPKKRSEITTDPPLVTGAKSSPNDNIHRRSSHEKARFGKVDGSIPLMSQADPVYRKVEKTLAKRHVALRIQIFLTFCVFAINLGVSCWLTSRNGTINGSGTIFTGNCDKAAALSIWLHLVINICSTILLGCSNYCMQLLSSPTREEVDTAHEKHTCMDIGAPSVRNLLRLQRKYGVVWLALCLSSSVLHLFWNSAIFKSLPTYPYDIALATSDFRNFNQPWGTQDGIDFDTKRLESLKWERLDVSSCINRYIYPLNGAKDVIVVLNLTTMDNGNKSLIRSIPFGSPGNLRTTWYKFGYWVCSASQNVLRRDDGGCTKEVLSYYQPVWTLGLTATEPPAAVAPVIYCLSEGLHPIDEQCGLHFSIVVLWVVCGLNLFKLLCICFVFLDKDKTHKSLVTMGDMVASFLKEEDTHTNSDMWTSTRRFFHQAGGWNRSINPRSAPTGGEKWFKACSRWQFSITILLNFGVMIIVTVFLALAISALKRDRRPTDRLGTYGLGKVDSQNILMGSAPTSLTTVIVLANCPQLIFSFLYFTLNATFTTMLVAWEWSKYSSHRKALRVSIPTGMQRSTYFLTVPYKYGVPLMAVSTLLQWLLSQAVFLIRTAGHEYNGSPHPAWDESKIGFSPLGLVLVLILFVFVVAVFLIIGFLRKYPTREKAMPLASTCSAAISAACHGPKEDENSHLLPVQWGVVSGEGEPLVCAFTTARNVRPPPQQEPEITR